MKKHFFSKLMQASLICCLTLILTGCEDIPETPSVDPVTQESYINDNLMDRSVKPGDSFFDFALGVWIKTHDPSDRGLVPSLDAMQSYGLMLSFQQSSDPLLSKLMSFATDNYTEGQALEDIVGLLQKFDIGDGNGIKNSDFASLSRQDFVDYLGNLVDGGFSPLVARGIGTKNGLFIKVLTAGSYSEGMQKVIKMNGDADAITAIEQIMARIMAEGETLPDGVAEGILAIEKALAEAENDQYSTDLCARQYAAPVPPLKASAVAARSRGADGMTASNLYKDLGVEEDYVDPKAQPIIDIILNEDVPTLCYYLCFNVMSELESLVPDPQNPEYNLKDNVYQKLLKSAPEIVSRVDYEVLKNDIDIDGCQTMMEQMRALFDQRIAALDWMGDATKAEARKKLAAMKFNIGLPATKPGESLKLDGTDLMVSVAQLFAQKAEAFMALVGKPVADNGWNFYLQAKNLGDVNASYVPVINQLFILPAYIGKVLFPQDNEAMRYAVAHVFGHEMSHGFDAGGAKYDETGTLKDWWAPTDLAKFEALQQQMVTLYNQLWQYEGTHADGQATLEENMADLGGVRLAFELYRQKLTSDGRSTEEINHQLREFFLHFAFCWQSDPTTDELMEALIGDEHSTGRNRIIGITRLMDEWYELFNVTDGQWYLNPSDRVKIW